MTADVTEALAWEGARAHPHTYPGRVPTHDFVVLDDLVHPLRLADPDDPTSYEVLTTAHAWESLDTTLEQRGLPPLANRHPVITYGANRNPASLVEKASQHRYQSPGDGLALPVLRARLANAEIVAAAFGLRGSVFADLVTGIDASALISESVEVWVNLVDDDGLRMLHDSERVPHEVGYRVARLSDIALTAAKRALTAMAYVTDAPTMTLPTSGAGQRAPVAYSTIPASGRRLRALDQVDIVAELLAEPGLAGELAGPSGLANLGDGDQDTTRAFIARVNQLWWTEHRTGERPVELTTIVRAVHLALAPHRQHFHTAAHLHQAGLVLETADAYHPGDDLHLSRQLN
jgi:hypothetical protein